MAFRAWNRGLATTTSWLTGRQDNYGLWIFNGARWFPDPTFPGQSECSGNKVLWAGKLDYWVIGAGQWGSLCRFDGVNYQWEPLPVPVATLARVPRDSQGKVASGSITAGTCFSWDNCWFFGTFGVVVHWDGQSLRDASPGLGVSPWLRGGYFDAAVGTDGTGNRVGFAVGGATDGGATGSDQLPAQPDGLPPPQLFGSSGSAFTELPFSPPTVPTSGSPYQTDLVAVATDGQGRVWVAGRPTGDTARDATRTGPAPLLPVSTAGGTVACAGYGPNSFQTYGLRSGHDSYLWAALSGFPGTGNVLAGAQYQPPSAGTGLNDDGSGEPALVLATCDQAPQVTRFRIPDPSGGSMPADRTGAVAAVAANAVNDAWAATTTGASVSQGTLVDQPPHFYHLTDGQAPQAPAGDDEEARQLVFTVDPPIYVQSPGVVPAAQPVSTTVTKTVSTVRRKKALPPIYAFKAGKPIRLRNGKFLLKFTFKVRPPAAIGIEATRGKRKQVVSTTGLRHFRGTKGQLVLTLDRRRWPDHFRFILPKTVKPHSRDALGPAVLAWTVVFSG